MLWRVVAAVGLIGALAAVLIPAFLGSTIPPSSYFGMSVWIGIFTALYAKRKGKSGWRWFFTGFLGVGFTLAFLISFMSTFLSNRNNIDKQLFKISAFKTLSAKDPVLYEKLKKDIAGTYKKGKLDNAKLHEISEKLFLPTIIKYAKTASDEAIIEFTKWMVVICKKQIERNPTVAYEWMVHSKSPSGYERILNDKENEKYYKVIDLVISTGAESKGFYHKDNTVIQRNLEKVFKNVIRNYGNIFDSSEEAKLSAEDKKRLASGYVSLYEEILSFPYEDSADLARYVFSQ